MIVHHQEKVLVLANIGGCGWLVEISMEQLKRLLCAVRGRPGNRVVCIFEISQPSQNCSIF
jgi:hypothetical protein